MILYIPSLWIMVPVKEAQSGNGQAIIDQDNMAVLLRWGDLSVIADHNAQNGFSRLNKAVPQKTAAYIISGGQCRRYVCDYSVIGHTRDEPSGRHLYDDHWLRATQMFMDGLLIYTCMQRSADTVMDVRLTHWKLSTGG